MVYSFSERSKRRLKLVRDHKINRSKHGSNGAVEARTPNFYTFGEEPKRFFDFMGSVAQSNLDRDIYLDGNHATFCSPLRVRGPFYLYFKCLRSAFAPVYNEKFKSLSRKMDEIADGFSRVVENPNVFITGGIRREIDRYKENLESELDDIGYDSKFREEVLKPVEKICQKAGEANLRLEDREEDPLIDRIVGGIRDSEGERFGKTLSHSDKRLMAIALATALIDGREKLVLTYDKGIHASLGDLFERVRTGSSGISVDGVADSFADFEEVNIGLGRVLYYAISGDILLNETRFKDFFGKGMKF